MGHRCERWLECPSVRAQLRARGDGGPRRGSGFAASLQTPLAASLFSWLRAVRRPSHGRPVLRLRAVAVRCLSGARVASRRGDGRGPLAVVAARRRRRARRPRGVAVVGHVCGRFSSAVLWLTHKAVLFGARFRAAPASLRSSAQTTLKSFEFHAAGRGLSVCTRGDVELLSLDSCGLVRLLSRPPAVPPSRPDEWKARLPRSRLATNANPSPSSGAAFVVVTRGIRTADERTSTARRRHLSSATFSARGRAAPPSRRRRGSPTSQQPSLSSTTRAGTER